MEKIRGPFMLASKETKNPPYKMENEMEEVNTETITAEDVECDIDLMNQVAEQEAKDALEKDKKEAQDEAAVQVNEDAFKLTPEMIKMIKRMMRGNPNTATKKKITPSMRKSKRSAQKKARRKNRK